MPQFEEFAASKSSFLQGWWRAHQPIPTTLWCFSIGVFPQPFEDALEDPLTLSPCCYDFKSMPGANCCSWSFAESVRLSRHLQEPEDPLPSVERGVLHAPPQKQRLRRGLETQSALSLPHGKFVAVKAMK